MDTFTATGNDKISFKQFLIYLLSYYLRELIHFFLMKGIIHYDNVKVINAA